MRPTSGEEGAKARSPPLSPPLDHGLNPLSADAVDHGCNPLSAVVDHGLNPLSAAVDHGFNPLSAVDHGYNPLCSTDQADPFTTKLASGKIGAGHKVTPPHNQTGSSASKSLENETLDQVDPLASDDDEEGVMRPRLGEGSFDHGPAAMVVSSGKLPPLL